MKKVALVFVVAVLVPSLVLAWLAVRSLRDQQFILERQQLLLCQGVTDTIARQIETFLADRQRDFALQIEQMLDDRPSGEVARGFDEQLRRVWPLAEVGFAVTKEGEMVSPTLNGRLEARTFLRDNSLFIGNQETANVYWYNEGVLNDAKQLAEQQTDSSPQSAGSLSSWRGGTANRPDSEYNLNRSTEVARKKSSTQAPTVRSVMPEQQLMQQRLSSAPVKDKLEAQMDQIAQLSANFSKIAPAEAEFQQLVGDATDGTIARFVNNKLNVLFWHRSTRDARHIFGAQLALPRLVAELRGLIQNARFPLQEDICIALLNDNARPEVVSQADFTANWKRPFVASEISEALPHWEVAAYLLNPAQFTQSAHTLKLTLGLLIAALLLAIGVGSWLIVSDLNRQLRLARQKTDFVSNVSHELKTPLTSIRMFSELLAEQRVTDAGKQRSYLNIITAETARLTRLINNVLDFSRMERGEKKYNFRDADLVQLVRETAESYRPHLENNGFKLECALPEFKLPVRGDPDALAQVIVNLLSNAEKYSNDNKEITVEAARRDGPLPCAEARVLDRGPGVPRGSEDKIFEKFYRAHDSLSNGIQGSGLGLTLARQIARAHGGDVFYEKREGGGSCFSLRLPLTCNPAGTDVRRL
jgi:signal transduction histidine kinase